MNNLICFSCKKTFPLDEPLWKCPCGGLLDIEFTPQFPLDRIQSRKSTMWRYREAIPIEDDKNIVSFDEGYTPLIEIMYDDTPVVIKLDFLFPTGSFKDRGASVLASKVRELGIGAIVEDSSGNAGAALAAYSTKAGIKCDIYVPEDTSGAKLTQIKCYGAMLHKIHGSREDTALAALKAAQTCYYASHSWNPFFLQGTKTFAFEVCEQLGWRAPDTLVLPVGNGTLLLGAYIGFQELAAAGIISKVPRMIAIQSAQCAPLYRAFMNNLPEIPEVRKEYTVAEGIAVARPIRGKQVVNAVKKSGGYFITVEEHEIIDAQKYLCREGLYVEPTAAVAAAGVERYIRDMRQGEVIVTVLTGHGLKSV